MATRLTTNISLTFNFSGNGFRVMRRKTSGDFHSAIKTKKTTTENIQQYYYLSHRLRHVHVHLTHTVAALSWY